MSTLFAAFHNNRAAALASDSRMLWPHKHGGGYDKYDAAWKVWPLYGSLVGAVGNSYTATELIRHLLAEQRPLSGAEIAERAAAYLEPFHGQDRLEVIVLGWSEDHFQAHLLTGRVKPSFEEAGLSPLAFEAAMRGSGAEIPYSPEVFTSSPGACWAYVTPGVPKAEERIREAIAEGKMIDAWALWAMEAVAEAAGHDCHNDDCECWLMMPGGKIHRKVVRCRVAGIHND